LWEGEAVPTETQASADPEFVRASHEFLYSWLVADNFDHTSAYFSERSYNCISDYLPSDQRAPSTSTEYAAYIRSAMTSVGQDVGRSSTYVMPWNRFSPNMTT
jgi:hypothetical protein